jgi:RP/EB family microtubule-associated protein
LHIDRHIDVDRLITAKYMDNLEFMQWFKRYFEMQVADKGDYDCKARRSLGKGGASVASGKPSSPTAGIVKASGMEAPVARATTTKTAVKVVSPKPASAPAPATKKAASMATLPSNGRSPSPSDNNTAKQVAALMKQVDELKAANEEASRSGNELRTEMEGLEKERDFYFEKLREIEIVMQDVEDNGKGTDLTASIFKILYATQDGFEQSADFQPSVNENAPPLNLVASSPVQQLVVDNADDM